MSLVPEFRMISEDDEHVYDTFSSFAEALDTLHQFPNDHIEVHLVQHTPHAPSKYEVMAFGDTEAELVADALAKAAAYYGLPADRLAVLHSYVVRDNLPAYNRESDKKRYAYVSVGISHKEDTKDGTAQIIGSLCR